MLRALRILRNLRTRTRRSDTLRHWCLPEMIAFLEGGAVSRKFADKSVAYAGERLVNAAQPRGVRGARRTFAEGEITWLAPVPRPPMIRDDILLLDHYRLGMEKLFKIAENERLPEAARSMPIFWKPSRAAVGAHRQPIRWPKYSEKLDYEFELRRFVGRKGKTCPPSARSSTSPATRYSTILGLRDVQPVQLSLHMGPAKAKDFETSKFDDGRCLVAADELSDPHDLRMVTRVNSETWFDGRRADGRSPRSRSSSPMSHATRH